MFVDGLGFGVRGGMLGLLARKKVMCTDVGTDDMGLQDV